jgi:hypothetical protein
MAFHVLCGAQKRFACGAHAPQAQTQTSTAVQTLMHTPRPHYGRIDEPVYQRRHTVHPFKNSSGETS